MEQERVYSPNQAAVGSFIGGPLVSVMFIKRNFKVLGNSSGEDKALMCGTIVILIILGILPFLPKSFPDMLIPLMTIIATRSIVEKYQLNKQDITSATSLTFQSNWRVLWVSLACLVLSVLVIGVVLVALHTLGIVKLV